MEITENKVIQIFKQTAGMGEEEPLTKNSRFTDLNIDSLTFIRFIVNLEKLFEIELDDCALYVASYNTIGDIINLLQMNTNAGE